MTDRTALLCLAGSLVAGALFLVLGSALDVPVLSVLGVVAIGAAFVFRAIWDGTFGLWIVVGGVLVTVVGVAYVASLISG